MVFVDKVQVHIEITKQICSEEIEVTILSNCIVKDIKKVLEDGHEVVIIQHII